MGEAPKEVLARYRDQLMPGCDLTAVDKFLEDYLAAVDAARAKAIREERMANAAPAMYEALEGVLRVADRATVEFDAARAALAAARGEEAK